MNGMRFPAATALALLLAVPASAQEWTRFRGPNGTGISSASIPVECGEAAWNWRVALPGVGHSSPVVWGDRIFLTSAEEAAGKRHVLCLSARDGSLLWTRTDPFTTYGRHRYNSFASSTPAVDAERLYVALFSPDSLTLLALDHAGKEVWKRDLGRWEGNHGGAASPIVVDDLVVMRSDSDEMGPECFIVALDRKTGKTVWKLPRAAKNACYSTPVIYTPRGRAPELIFTSNAHGMFALDPKTGRVNWEQPGVFEQRCVAGPAILGDLIFATAGDGGGRRQAVAVRPGSPAGAPPKVEYQVTRGVPYVPTPLVIGDLMFLWSDVGGVVTCVRAATGETIWSERVGGDFFSSPVCAAGKIYAVDSRGQLVVIEAGPQFKLLGRSSLGETCHATPAISGGVMYVRTQSHLISLGGGKRAQR